MSPLIGKLAPAAAVAALVAWCCWPYLDESASGGLGGESSDVPQIADSRLSPDIKPGSQRDPFQKLGSNETNPAEAESSPKSPASPASVEEQPPSDEQIADVLGRLAVEATFIHGPRRLALIDGRLYEEGDPLAISRSLANACVVAQISADGVLVRHPGGTVGLTYRDPTTP